MKKLALLQLLLLPVAGLIDVPSAAQPSRARAQCEHVTREVSAWDAGEATVKDFARRFLGSGGR